MDINNKNSYYGKDINIFSSINCDYRNNYDKKFCQGLNNNRINNFLKPYLNDISDKDSYFEKNKYFLENETNIMKNISKEDCYVNCIENNYEGFKYEGDKNKCLLFSSGNLDNKIGNTFGDYSVKTFLKSRNTIDIDNVEDQLYSKNYFTEYNNYGHMPNDLIKELDIENEEQCMDYCIKDYDKCKSILYAEKPKKCTFYKNKTMKNKKDLGSNYDIYTVKKNKVRENMDVIDTLKNDYIKNGFDVKNKNDYYYCSLNNDKCILDYKLKNESIQNIREKDENRKSILYDCSGFYSTNPFCTKEYDPREDDMKDDFDYYSDCFDKGEDEGNLDKFKKLYNKKCKKKFGNEYVFDDNIYDLKNIMKCDDNNMEKVKCKMNFNSDNLILEKFENNNGNNNNFSNYILLFIILFLIINFLILCFS
jgi:hypothetical protein